MSTLPTTITSEWLVDHGACTSQRQLFEKEWPEGGNITKDSLIRGAELGLDLEWFAREIVPGLFGDEYRAKRDLLDVKYCAERDTLYTEYRTKRGALYAEYEVKVGPARSEYPTKRDSLDIEHWANSDALLAEYKAKINVLVLPVLLGQYTN